MNYLSFPPLNDLPEFTALMKIYEGKTFQWVFRLYNNSNNVFLAEPKEVELYWLAAGVVNERKRIKSVNKRRKEFRRAIRVIFKTGKIIENQDINSLLLTYCCTYEGPKKLMEDEKEPEIGILVEQNIDKEEDLMILMVPKDIFYKNYQVLLTGKKLKDCFNW